MIVLEQDDPLIMPPGTMVVRAPITLEDSLMDGGMFWDEQAILPTLENVLIVAKNPKTPTSRSPVRFRMS
jgi:hypothetical protein